MKGGGESGPGGGESLPPQESHCHHTTPPERGGDHCGKRRGPSQHPHGGGTSGNGADDRCLHVPSRRSCVGAESGAVTFTAKRPRKGRARQRLLVGAARPETGAAADARQYFILAG